MPYRTESEEIGGKTYESTTLPSSEAKTLFRDLVVLLGEPLFRLIATGLQKIGSAPSPEAKEGEAQAEPSDLSKIDTNEVVKAVASFVVQLKDTDVNALFRRALSKTVVTYGGRTYHLKNGEDYETHFSGEFEEEIKAFIFALKTNYRSFSKAWAALQKYGGASLAAALR